MKTKTTWIAFGVLLLTVLTLPQSSTAKAPYWAPAKGYKPSIKHIYFPEQNMYYDTHKNIYFNNHQGNWVAYSTIPKMFININLKVVPQIPLNICSNRPYIYNDNHRVKYWNKHIQKNYYKKLKRHELRREKAEKRYYKELQKKEKIHHRNRHRY